MAVSNITPASGATLNYAESFSFEVTDPYTSLLVRVTVSGGALEAAYDDGVAAGYTVTIEDLGATHKVTVKRDAGWSIDPMTVYVTENDTTTTNWTYDIFPTQEYPEGMQPYNDVATGAAGYGVNSFEGRTGNVVSALNDYDASEVNNDSSVTGATVKDALETLDAYSAPVDSVHGRTGAVVAATSDYDASQIDNDSGVAGATVKDALDALDARDEGQVDLKNKVSSPTIATQEDWNRYHGSVARVNGGGTITDDGDGTVTVSAGYGLIRATDSNTAVFYKVDWAETPITPTDGQLNFIYLEWNAGTPQMVVTTTKRTDLNTNIYMGSVHRSGTFLHPTTHVTPTGNVSAKLTKRFNDTEGLTRAAGSVTTEVGTRNVAITQGTWWHGLDEQTIAAVDTSVADTITTFYRDGVGGWTATGGVTQIPNDFYDDGSGTLQALSANRYGVYWLYVGVDNHTYMIYGRGDYTSSQWPDAIPPGDIPPHMQEQHSGIVARIVVQKGDTVFTDLVVPWDTAFTSSGVQEHHDLGGLTDDDHTQYVLGAGTRAQDALYLAERADHVNTPGAGFGELWLFNDVEQELRFTDDQGDDYKVATFSGSSPASNYVPVGFDNHGAGRLESSLLKYNAGELYLGDATGSLRMNERTTGPTPVAGDGYFWVRDGTDQNPMFTNDASEDIGLDLWELGSWNFNASTIGTPGVAEFDTNNAAITLTTTIRVTTTGNNEGQSRAWLEDLNNGYLLMKKRDNPYEEVQFKVTAGADVAGAWADLTVAWQGDSTADVNWATADQWTMQFLPGIPTTPTLDDIITDAAADNDVIVPLLNPVILRNNGQAFIPLTVETTSGAANALSVDGDTAGEAPLRLNDGTNFGWLGPTMLNLKESTDTLYTTGAGQLQLWVKDNATQQLRVTDDTNTDLAIATHTALLPVSEELLCFNGTTGRMQPTTGMEYDVSEDQLILRGTPYFTMQERTGAPTNSSGYGKWWVHNDAPNTPWFTNDNASEDVALSMHQQTITGTLDFSQTTDTWYSWNNGGPHYDWKWQSARGGGTGASASNPDWPTGEATTTGLSYPGAIYVPTGWSIRVRSIEIGITMTTASIIQYPVFAVVAHQRVNNDTSAARFLVAKTTSAASITPPAYEQRYIISLPLNDDEVAGPVSFHCYYANTGTTTGDEANAESEWSIIYELYKNH